MPVLKMLLKNAADALPEVHKVRLKGLFAAGPLPSTNWSYRATTNRKIVRGCSAI